MSESSYCGLLLVGDPHLSSRVPGYRKDKYPDVVLGKFAWALNYAQANHLLPIVLGDLFHLPRDNANWLVVRLIEIIGGRTVLGIVGNHDTTMHELQPDDTLAILEAAGSMRLVDRTGPWTGMVQERPVIIGGSTHHSPLPKQIDPVEYGAEPEAFVVWIAHHDIGFAGYESNAWYKPYEIPGVDVVVNGHIHTPSDGIQVGRTMWLNPGNIARVSRGDVHRARRPHVVRLDLAANDWESAIVEIPHQSYDDVFYDMDPSSFGQQINVSAFVQGLDSLRTLRTASGEGLVDFLNNNLQLDEPAVRDEIISLAEEVLNNGHS